MGKKNPTDGSLLYKKVTYFKKSVCDNYHNKLNYLKLFGFLIKRSRFFSGHIYKYYFNFIQQKSPTSISGEMNANCYEIQWGFKLRLNKVKASGGCLRFFKGNLSSKLDKNLGANTPRRI